MGCQLSRRNGTSPPIPQTNGNSATTASSSSSTTAMAQYMAELSSSYESACRVDPAIQSFDATLRQRTSHVISTVGVGVDLRSLSFDSLREVTGCLLDTNQEVLKMILECKKDIWKNPELFELVNEYFDNSIKTLDFYTALENCLKKAHNNQLILHVTLRRFEEEDTEDGDGKNKKYERTLEELRHFKDTGDPFTEEFFEMFRSVLNQQMIMLEKLHLRKSKLDKKLKSIKKCRKVTSIILAATLATVLICSVVAAAISAPPVAAALAASTTIPLGSMGKWFYSLWKGYEDAVKRESDLINAMDVGTYIAIKDLDSIRVLIEQLEIQINSLLHAADFALRDDDAVKFGVEEIKKKVDVFMKSIQDLCEQADRCSRYIRRARTVILRKIINHQS